MIRVHVFYENGPTVRFDHRYWATAHAELLRRAFEPHGMRNLQAERTMAGTPSGDDPPFVAVNSMEFPSLEALRTALAESGDALAMDIPNFSTVPPLLQVSVPVPHVAPGPDPSA